MITQPGPQQRGVVDPMADVDNDLDTPVPSRCYDSACALPAPGGSSSFVSIRPVPAQRGAVGSWAISDRGGSGQPTTQSLRILMIATEAPPVHGGIARSVGYLRNGFRERGHHVDVLAYPEVGRVEFGEVRLSGLIVRIPWLLSHINTYDVIHVHGITPTVSDVALLFALFTPHRSRRPMVIYTHHVDLDFGARGSSQDFGPVGFLTRAYNHTHHRLSARADAVIASTVDGLGWLGEDSRGFVIPLGIDLDHFCVHGEKDRQFTVLFVGQFRPWKGVQVLLQAMSGIECARLLIAGHGPEECAYRSLAAELGVDVEFHVAVDDDQLRQLYQRAHVIVAPSTSRLEAFGLALIEGMAAGCVPIASDLPGVREVVGQAGFLFPTGDAKQLATTLRILRDDRALVQRMSEHARVHALAFSREREVREYERLIAALVEWRELKRRRVEPVGHMADYIDRLRS